MSVPLLRNPDKLHDLVDDLESVFWVFVYGAVKHYALPPVPITLNLFDDQRVDGCGRAISGLWKDDALERLDEVHYTSAALKDVIWDCSMAWQKFRIAQRGVSDFNWPVEMKEDIMKMLELAGKPSYWVAKVSHVLRTHSSPEHAPSPEVERSESPPQSVSKGRHTLRRHSARLPRTSGGPLPTNPSSKRKTLHDADIPATQAALRRSKRLKSMYLKSRNSSSR